MIIFLQIIAVITLIALGAFFSGSETGVYRLSRFRLRVGVEQKRPFYSLLNSIMHDSQKLIFSILLGNNLANCLVTALVTVILLNAFDNQQKAQLYTTLLMTPVLFTFSEVIPKNIYYYQADKLMLRFGPLLWSFHWLFKITGATWLLGIFAKSLARLIGASGYSPVTVQAARRERIRALIQDTHEEGILSTVQQSIMNRLVNVPNIRVGAVMTPISKMVTVDIESSRDDLLAVLGEHEYTNYPAHRDTKRKVIGTINIYEVLAAGIEFDDLTDHITDVECFAADMTLIDAIAKMQHDELKMVMVVSANRAKKKVIGLITMKDLVEELTGELVQW